MKRLVILLSVILFLLCCCSKKNDVENIPDNVVMPEYNKEELDAKLGTDEVYIVKTYMESPTEEISSYLDQNMIFTKVKHYLLSDGTWETDEHNYKYKLELKGRLNNAVRDSTYIILSNNPDITFDMAWKASGLSSNLDDYFKPEEAIIVAVG